jgi:mono/diheme cytochrome c family protein
MRFGLLPPSPGEAAGRVGERRRREPGWGALWLAEKGPAPPTRGRGAAFSARHVFALMSILTLLAGAPPEQSAFAQSQTPAFTPRDESPEDFPPGPGREETFYACVACHNFKLVAAQGMDRARWDESLTFMTQRHNMPPLEGEERRIVLDYLEKTYPPRAPARPGGWQNPFAPR